MKEIEVGDKKVVISDEMMALANDNWAEVELFRWQYGELPKPTDSRRLNLAEAAAKMAKAVSAGDVSPFNAASVIAYLGKVAGEKAALPERKLPQWATQKR